MKLIWNIVSFFFVSLSLSTFVACKRKEEQQTPPEHQSSPKKPRLVFTDLQRRTLQAIFKVISGQIFNLLLSNGMDVEGD